MKNIFPVFILSFLFYTSIYTQTSNPFLRFPAVNAAGNQISFFPIREISGWPLKQNLGQTIFNRIEPDWTYKQEEGISSDELEQSSLLKDFPMVSPAGKDLLTGKYKHTAFQCAQVDFSFVKENGKNYAGSSYLILMADFHKDFKGKTIIVPDKAQRTFGKYLGKKIQQFGRKGLDLVYLEDPRFEEQFAVFANDQIEARYLITPKLMEKLVQIRNKFRKNLQVAFANNKIYIALETPPLMDFNATRPLLLEGTFNHFYARQELAKYLMDELCLNDRLWSKT